MKIISRSNAKELGLKFYFTGAPCKRGHVSKRLVSSCGCYECSLINSKNSYHDWYSKNKDTKNKSCRDYYDKKKDEIKLNKLKYRSDNKGLISERNKEHGAKYRLRNKEKLKEKSAAYYRDNKDKVKRSCERYQSLNKEKIKARQKIYNERNKEARFLRKSLNRILSNWRGGRADAEIEIGYTINELRDHMQGLFVDGMSWDNHGEWHIDHIKPVSVFVKEGVTDPKVVNALSNLQPLWSLENISKGASYQE